jgi:hypothetical protein
MTNDEQTKLGNWELTLSEDGAHDATHLTGCSDDTDTHKGRNPSGHPYIDHQ